MKFAYDIPDSFWSLFRSMNRELYMEALLKINEEYEYNNYYLSKEVCLQVLEDWNESQRIWLSPEEFESENDASQTPPNRILNWLIKTGWLKRIEDFSTLTTNIIIPDYAAIMEDAYEYLSSFIATLYGILDPELFVLSGSVALKIPGFIEEIEKRAKGKVYDALKGNVKIVPAALGEDCGLIGAACLAFSK